MCVAVLNCRRCRASSVHTSGREDGPASLSKMRRLHDRAEDAVDALNSAMKFMQERAGVCGGSVWPPEQGKRRMEVAEGKRG